MIYTDKFDWKIAKEIKLKDVIKFQSILEKAKKDFLYNTDYDFIKSIKTNYELDNNYIASYDSSKTGLSIESYIVKMQELLNEANRQLNRAFKYNSYKFDLIGNWSCGRIIMMEKK